MKVEIVEFGPYDSIAEVCLNPALMAAIAARYSRSNLSMESILDSVSAVPEQHKVDAVFKYNDYGHRSIMNMLIIPIRFEGISMYAAARLFQFSPQGAGQESSTRYISSGFDVVDQYDLSDDAYLFTKNQVKTWLEKVQGIPSKATRQERNEVLDSVRYDLPVNARTNVFLVQSARAWLETCNCLLSYPHDCQEHEIAQIVSSIHAQIESKAGPYPMKHIGYNPSLYGKYDRADNFRGVFKNKLLDILIKKHKDDLQKQKHNPKNFFATQVYTQGGTPADWHFTEEFEELHNYPKRRNRYDSWPRDFYMTHVHVGIIANFAEVRDLNRHTNRDYVDWEFMPDTEVTPFPTLGSNVFMFWQCSLAQLLYEIEIRTSQGAHPSYRAIMNEVLDKLLSGENCSLSFTKEYVEQNLFANQEVFTNQE